MLALQGTYETFKSHTCINHVHGKLFQRTICLAIELHEHEVPNLDYLWVVLVNEFSSWHLCLFLRCARVEVYLRTRSARSRISHFPEVVVLVSVDDMVGRNMLSPIAGCFIVAWDIFLWWTFEYRYIEVGGIEVQHIYQVFPSHIDGTLLEVVAKTPVAQHLKHGVVISIVSHFLQIVVLTAYAKAFLCIGSSAWLWLTSAENDVFPLVHSCVGEHQRRVVFDNHRGWRYDSVSFRLEVILEWVADFFCCHHIYWYLIVSF